MSATFAMHPAYAKTLVLALLFGLPGCGDRSADSIPVSGTVLIDGRPLEGGMIRFVPKVGRPASSKILADGSFDLAAESIDRASVPGIPPGEYRVQVSASNVIDDKTIRWHAPQRYADFRTSGLKVVVLKPVTDLVIELESEKTGESGAATDGSPDSSSDAKSAEATKS